MFLITYRLDGVRSGLQKVHISSSIAKKTEEIIVKKNAMNGQ